MRLHGLVLAWSSLALLLAQTAPAPPESKPVDTCIVEGRVINAATGEPVGRVRLFLRPLSGGLLATAQATPASYRTTTGADGKFSMKDLAPGNYRLRAQRNGFVSAEYGAKGTSGTGTTLELEKGQHRAGIEFKLTPHSVIAGRVQDEIGEPVANASVRAVRYGYQYGRGRKQAIQVGSATTNDLGEYRIFGLQPGRYFVVARDESTLSAGTPPEDRSANPRGAEDYVPTFYPGTTDAQSAGQVDISAGVPVQGINLTLAKAQMVRVRGRLVNQTDAPGGRLSIMLLPREPMGYPNIMSSSVGPQGQFDFRRLVPGSYSLAAAVYPGQQTSSPYSTHVNLEVGAEDIDNLVVTVRMEAEISGSVRAEGDSKVKLAGLRVSLRPAEPVDLTVGELPSATVRDDGSFVLRNAGGEPQVVSVSGLPSGTYVKSIRTGESDALEDPLDLKGGAAAKLSVVIGENAGEVAGTVADDDQKPVASAMVVLIPDSEKRRRFQQFYRTALTNQAGRYSITSVDPGSYRVYVWDDVESGAWMDPEFLEPLRSKGKAVRIEEGSRENLELQVIAAAN